MIDEAERYRAWVGRTERVEEDLCSAPARAAAATLDAAEIQTGRGAPLPPLWHWFYFLATAPQSRLDVDGHPERSGFMPPVPLPRRMFAGARLRILRPLTIGRPAIRQGEIRDVTLKTGRSGSLAFVTVGYKFLQEDEVCIEEEQDIVYREPGAPIAAPTPVEWPRIEPGAWSREVSPDSRLLFRFSAMTFNAHRIHYDWPYATREEGYPGLVVHGPLTALLLADLVRRHASREMETFSFRGKAPLFDLAPFRLVGRPDGDRVELEAQGPDGRPALSATAVLSPAR